jgi:hypothetical protein
MPETCMWIDHVDILGVGRCSIFMYLFIVYVMKLSADRRPRIVLNYDDDDDDDRGWKQDGKTCTIRKLSNP